MADGDITSDVNEVVPDVTAWNLDSVHMYKNTQVAKVLYKKVDSNGDDTGLKRTFLFRNVADDPDTPEDETSTKFTQFINYINSRNSILLSIENACRIEAGLPTNP